VNFYLPAQSIGLYTIRRQITFLLECRLTARWSSRSLQSSRRNSGNDSVPAA